MKEQEEHESHYNKYGDATHYDGNRLNTMIKYERTYGTLAVMNFCEINADKYRDRIGKKHKDLALDVKKIEWYEKAAKYYFEKLDTGAEIVINNKIKKGLPWKKKK